MQRSYSNPRSHRRRTITKAVASTAGFVLLFGASLNEFANASSIRLQSPSLAKATPNRSSGASAGYLFDLGLDVTTEGAQPARTSFRGRASLAEIDTTTSRIQIQSIEMTQTDSVGLVKSIELSSEFRSAFNESFEAKLGTSPTLVVGETEPEEVTNIKRALAKQIALTPDENQPVAVQLAALRSDITDGFGTFKNRTSLTRSKGKVFVKQSRTEGDYTQLAVPESLNPDVVVQSTNVYNQTTGMLESSQTFEAITVDYGTLPQSPQNPNGEGPRIVQTASSRMSVSKSGPGEPVASPTQQQRVVPIDTVVTDDMVRSARKASAPTFDEAMATIAAAPDAPSAALGLGARLQSDPLAMGSLRKTLEAGTPPEFLPAVTAALLETNTAEAQAILATSILGRGDLSAEQRQHLALSIASIENPIPSLLGAIRAATSKELLSTEVRRPERPDPTECQLDPDCIPGGGGPTGSGTPPLMTFPYAKTWNQRIGNGVLGADIGAAISITRNPNTTNDFNSDVNAYARGLALGHDFPIVDANLKTISDSSGNRNVEASIDIRGRGRETFTTTSGCNLDLEGNLYEGTLPLFAASFWIPVGPVVFYGGASGAGHVSVPWSVGARTCGSDGFAAGRFDPNVFVEVRAYGGISIIIASAGIEAIGTIAHFTMSPSAKIRWKPTVSPEAAAEFRLQMAFQPFALRVRAWLRVFFWTKRWTLAEWSTPTRIWVAALAQTANWSLVNSPGSLTAIAPVSGSKAVASVVTSPPSTLPSSTSTAPQVPNSQGSKPVSVQSIAVPTSTLPITTPPVTTVPTTIVPVTITTLAPTSTTTTTTTTTTPSTSTIAPVPTTMNPTGTKPVPVSKPVQLSQDSLIPAGGAESKAEK
jgi:hypothetical protein